MFVICGEGKTRARIVVHPKAAPVEIHAAEELRRYILEMTGKELTITSEARGENLPIYIGAAVPDRVVSETRRDLGVDGFAIHCDDKQMGLH